MAVIKCKICGGDIQLNEDKTFGTCEYCGSTTTLPKVSDDQRAAAFNRGNHFRRTGDFDKALAVYERIVAEDDADAEAHWCCALCRFGIEYVEDPNTYEYLPTCHRASFDSILEDVDYLAAIEHSDGITRRQYQKDAAKIAEVQRGILATSQKEEPFDVFICYKETDDATKERTRDSLDAQEIYYSLTQEGYRVFFSRITLEDKAGSEYEPYIFAALNSAKVMVAVGEKPEHFSAVWVKNEWSRFLALMKKDRSKILLPCYKNMDPYDLPEQLSILQSYDMSKIGFMQDLIRGIKKIIGNDKSQAMAKETVDVAPGGGNVNLTAQIKRGHQALEDREWEKADEFFDRALDMDAECAEAFFGKALAAAHCVNGEELVSSRISQVSPGAEKLEACERESERINEAVKQYSIPEYFPEKDVRSYFAYDEREYNSHTKGWEECIAQEKTYWDNTDRNLSRALQYAKGELALRYSELKQSVLSALEMKRAESIEADGKIKAEVAQRYANEVENALQNVVDKFERACRKREYNYESYCRFQEGADTATNYLMAAEQFEHEGMRGYRDSDERAKQCRAEAERLQAKAKAELDAAEKAAAERAEQERIARAEQERIDSENKRIAEENAAKKRKRIIAITAPIVIACLAFLIALTSVIIPNQKLNKALGLIDSGDYEAAYALLEEIGNSDAIASSKYDRAAALIDIGDYEAAYALLEEIGNNDAIASSKYDRAIALIDSGDYEAAYVLLNGLNYKDSTDKQESIKPQYLRILFSRAQVGDYIVFGAYEQDNNTSNGKEDIEWLVLETEGNRVLVISRYALDCQKYNTDNDYITWETCSLRTWLNGTFINNSFSSNEQEMIKSTTVTADNNPEYSTPPGNNTTDKVFLLSIEEANIYFSSASSRQCQATAYAKTQGAYTDLDNDNCWWWLRSPGNYSSHAAIVRNFGSVNKKGVVVNRDNNAVRPALWIDLES